MNASFRQFSSGNSVPMEKKEKEVAQKTFAEASVKREGVPQ